MTATDRALRQIAQPPAETPEQWAARMQGVRRLPASQPRFSGAQQGHVLRRWMGREWPPTWMGLVMGALAGGAMLGATVMGWA